ncbi:ABC transporter ATP-binding protein [Paenibacillus baekrokdamisoli]|uniref:ABC transporter ATP-binding protein n=1 Tax=Paenibacillus baekrokdamisoli TaxID=1712516 RepID=A0A3G9JCY3_9BACL|nr:ABC transporter ATP-binding protein [Paenibacillus baekrokdamisoli]MBB3068999.1 oligopeptide transport system ATP-binding protein [Paenibacillus baekrokdamisoli]BBH23821.1 ABC transporter ATP-binding protein [Paenibacillus baekrokdamisoli]
MGAILQVKDLEVSFYTYIGEVHAVRGVDFSLEKGETLAIVGESGSGKSVTSKSIMGLLARSARIKQGEIRFEDKDLAALPERQMQAIRGSEIAMIFQDPMTSLNPTLTVGKQIIEVLQKHRKLGKRDAVQRVIELLALVGIPNPDKRMKQYPHQLSGGMRQRIVIAMALACDPKVLIADEPTTALDVTIQSQILDLMRRVQSETGTSIILITHDLGVVANMADRVAIMYGGKIVETGTVEEVFYKSRHPYTWGLLASMPKLHEKSDELLSIPGTPPDMMDPPKGCPFAARCSYAMEVCFAHMPVQTEHSSTHRAACWLQDPRSPQVARPASAGGEC